MQLNATIIIETLRKSPFNKVRAMLVGNPYEPLNGTAGDSVHFSEVRETSSCDESAFGSALTNAWTFIANLSMLCVVYFLHPTFLVTPLNDAHGRQGSDVHMLVDVLWCTMLEFPIYHLIF